MRAAVLLLLVRAAGAIKLYLAPSCNKFTAESMRRPGSPAIAIMTFPSLTLLTSTSSEEY